MDLNPCEQKVFPFVQRECLFFGEFPLSPCNTNIASYYV